MLAARLVKRYDIDTYEVILLTDIESGGIAQYSHLLVATLKGEEEACYVVSAEVDLLDGCTHYLGSFPGTGHINHGSSDDWAELSCFKEKAKELMSEKLNIRFP